MLDDPKYDAFINKLVSLGVIETADELGDIALAFNKVAKSADNATESTAQYKAEAESLEILNENINTALDSIQKSRSALEEFKSAMSNGMTDSALDAVADLSDELKAMVAEFYAGTVSADELFKALTEHYDNDLENYSKAIIAKNQYSQEFYNKIGLSDSEFVNHMYDNYNVDISNCKSYADAKLKIEQTLLGKASAMWSKYYNAQSQSFTQEWTNINSEISKLQSKKQLANSLGVANLFTIGGNPLNSFTEADNLRLQQLISIRDNISNRTDAYESAIDALNKITYDGISSNFEGIGAALSQSSASSSSSTSSNTIFDWIKTKFDNLNDKLDETKEKANDTLNGWTDRSNAYNQSLAQILGLKAEQEKARARYLEEANKSGLSNDYKRLVEQGAIQIDKLLNDDPLKEQIESYQKWYEKVKECDETIKQLDEDYIKWTNDSREFRWEAFDYLEDSISRITEEAYDLIDLLSNKDLFDDKGNLNKYGNATLALYASNINTYKQQAKDYLEEMKSLQKELANGGGQEVLDKYNERADAHREAILAIEKEKQAMLDLVEEGMQSQLDAINEMIAKKKESLNLEKEGMDYQKKISDLVKERDSLEKQRLAYKNDTSESGRMLTQQIEAKLSDINEEIEQTEYEKYISDQEKMFDSISSDYEEWISQRLENSESLLKQIVDSLSGNGEIGKTLKEIADSYGLNISDSLISSATGDTNGAINGLVNNILNLLGGNASLLGNVGGYANGTLSATKGLHRFNEKGNEIIIRKSDGSMLRNFDRGDVVISNEGAKLLSKFAENPSAFMERFGVPNVTPVMPNITLPKMPVMQNRQTEATPLIHDVNMTFELPNVKNTDDFINDMIRSTRFEKFIQEITLGQALGKNPLNKYRYIK